MDDKRFEKLLEASFDMMTPEQLDKLGGIEMKKKNNILGKVTIGLTTAAVISLLITGAFSIKNRFGIHGDNGEIPMISQQTEDADKKDDSKTDAPKKDTDTTNSKEKWLSGKWYFDVNITAEKTTEYVNLFELFGEDACDNGAYMIFDNSADKHEIIYCMGALENRKGTYSINENNEINAQLSSQNGEASDKEKIKITTEEIDGIRYLVTDYSDKDNKFKMYWSRQGISADTNDISDQSEPIYSDDYDEWKQEMSYKRNNQFLYFTPAKAQIAGMKFISGEYNALSHTSEDGEKLSDGSINVVYRKNKTGVDNDYGFSLKVYTTFKYDSIDKIGNNMPDNMMVTNSGESGANIIAKINSSMITKSKTKGNNIYSFSIRYGDVGLMCYKNTIKDEVKIGNFEGENVTDEYNVYNMGIDIYADCTPKEFEEILDSIQENVKTLEKK